MEKVEVVVIGAGVVGLACARQLALQGRQVVLLDQHRDVGQETSSRNSEVIHAGLYYPQDSLKAKMCVEGKDMLYRYCTNKHIPYQKIGKLIVATNELQIERLNEIHKTAIANDVSDTRLLPKQQIAELEPNVAAIAGLFSPSTGIIDSHSYMQSLLADFEKANGCYVGLSKVVSINSSNQGFELEVNTQGEYFSLASDIVINAAGLHATTVANNILGLSAEYIPQSYLCKGNYFSYQGSSPFKHLIYPLPTKHGLGIHATIDIGGQVKFGPDTEMTSTISYQVDEQRKRNFVDEISRYFPTLDADKLHPAYSGIRPKLKMTDGAVQDFVIQTEQLHKVKGLVNLFGIESPGLTASLAIAEYVSSGL